MPFAWIPLLAQTLTIAAGDRAELRWVANENESRFEAEDRATIGVTLDSKSSSIGAEYSPSLVLTPLEDSRRDLSLFHHVGLGTSIRYQLSRRTNARLSATASYDRVDSRLQALSGATLPGPPPPTSGVPDPAVPSTPLPTETPQSQADGRAANVTTETGTARSELAVSHALTRRSSLYGFIGYSATTGLGDSRDLYPLVQGPDASASYSYALSRRDALSTNATARYAFTSRDEQAFVASISEGWTHRFSQYSSLSIGAGITYVYLNPRVGPSQQAIYPGAAGGTQIAYVDRSKVGGGILTLSIGASYGTTLDQSTFRPNARIGIFSTADWTRDRLALYANVGGVISAEPNDPGALNSIGAGLGTRYNLGSGFALESGVRAGWQTYEQLDLLPPSVVVFVALTWGSILYRN